VPRHQLAAVHELAALTMLSAVPGETLGRLAERMERVDLEPGATIGGAAAGPDRFYLVLSGMLSTTGGMLRVGDSLGPGPLASPARAVVPTAVASCDRETYERYIAPLS